MELLGGLNEIILGKNILQSLVEDLLSSPPVLWNKYLSTYHVSHWNRTKDSATSVLKMYSRLCHHGT